MESRKVNVKGFFSKYGIVVVLIALMVFFSFMSQQFFTAANIFNILRQVAIVGIISVGMTMVLITGGIDLSVGSIAGVACVSTALFMNAGITTFFAVVLVLIVSAIIGLLNGFFINKLNRVC